MNNLVIFNNYKYFGQFLYMRHYVYLPVQVSRACKCALHDISVYVLCKQTDWLREFGEALCLGG